MPYFNICHCSGHSIKLFHDSMIPEMGLTKRDLPGAPHKGFLGKLMGFPGEYPGRILTTREILIQS